jgi:hypothetical protein
MADLSDARANLVSARTHISNEAWQSARSEVVLAELALAGVPDTASGGESLRLRKTSKDLMDLIDRLEDKASADSNKKRVVFLRSRFG